jgi:SAM-dependent methyltransferase
MTRQPDDYDQFADFYDLAYDTGFDGADINLYSRLARRYCCNVLEMGCGTGRVAIALASRGTKCIGIDSSRKMLRLARAKAMKTLPPQKRKLVRFVFGDMCRNLPQRQIGLIIFPYSSLLELRSTQQIALAVRHAYHALRQGGTLVVDNFLYGRRSPHRPNAEVREGRECFRGDGLKVRFSETDWYNAIAQTTERWLYADIVDSRKIIVDRKTWLIRRLYVEPEQMRRTLLKAGFDKEHIQLFGAFDERTPVNHPCFLEKSHALYRKARQVWICRKGNP